VRLEDDISLGLDISRLPTRSSCAVILKFNNKSQNSMDYTEENIKMEDIRQSTDCGDGCAKNSVVGLPYLNRPFWKSKNCKLLNGNYTFFRKAQIQVYMPEEPFKEDELGNTNVGVICK
jgi:hypothetical protein